MKTTLIIGITAATATAMFGVAGPASAFTFGTNGISFDTNQDVRFNFVHSKGAFQSTLKIFEVLEGGALEEKSALYQEVKGTDNGSKNDFLGTLGNAVQEVNKTFTFLAGRIYTLGLVSTYKGASAGTVYSTSSLNYTGLQRTVFGATGSAKEAKAFEATPFQLANPFSGPVSIGFEDIKWARADNDFNDFAVTAEAVPEPLTMGGLALGAAGLAAARRSRKRRTTEA
ncbi:PEP-CTERM sorting domain-containing protein [Laspinema olomoucense]|uniref:PEP-CTERM sorting domain-containing protein n=1 Tax=Laspinema olomoucense D3b TaxID=2953688 RepID=A0ABT2N3W0_9CYAN|nr:PEP-CTERM sorting domain-containing protein [Laspinema sp. D3b]MCT7977358.1 PEP-CTERM sorting domain-containing protein [Laspinema sp. D3b]